MIGNGSLYRTHFKEENKTLFSNKNDEVPLFKIIVSKYIKVYIYK